MYSLPAQTLNSVSRLEVQTQAAYGAIYEANAILGVARAHLSAHQAHPLLREIQRHLLTAGLSLASERPLGLHKELAWLQIEQESTCHRVPVLSGFVLPGGTVAASHLRQAGAVLQRASRELHELTRLKPVDSALVDYVYRVSGYIFDLSTLLNWEAGVQEEPY